MSTKTEKKIASFFVREWENDTYSYHCGKIGHWKRYYHLWLSRLKWSKIKTPSKSSIYFSLYVIKFYDFHIISRCLIQVMEPTFVIVCMYLGMKKLNMSELNLFVGNETWALIWSYWKLRVEVTKWSHSYFRWLLLCSILIVTTSLLKSSSYSLNAKRLKYDLN